jgi:hypothetical protein
MAVGVDDDANSYGALAVDAAIGVVCVDDGNDVA